MSQQRHVIKRQTVEVTLPEQRDAWSVQQQISRTISAQIMPIIEQCCTEISASDQIYRIAHLEVDLGEINPDILESDFSNKFSTAFRTALVAQINHIDADARYQQSSATIASHLELLSLFIQRGILPWWADFQQTQLPEASLDYLLNAAPEALRRLLTAWLDDNLALQRLIRYFDDSHLLALLELVLPSHMADFPAALYQTLSVLTERLAQVSEVPAASSRSYLWRTLLLTTEFANPTDRLGFFREMLSGWATAQGWSNADLLESVPATVFSSGKFLEFASSAPLKNHSDLDLEWMEVLSILQHDLHQPPRLANERAKFEAVLKDFVASLTLHLSEPLQLSLLSCLNRANNTAGIFTEFEAWILGHDAELPTSLPLNISILEQLCGLNTNSLAMRTRQQKSMLANHVDEMYVNNAGLVILWPFLNQFFARLGLLKESGFLHEYARQTAVALLQYLVNEDLNPPEYELTLNKLVCGMDLEELFDLETPLTNDHMQECQRLLTSVIEQAPILNKMSISGFRGSFLIRQGILSFRDGASLLRVEKETYDVVLERFPWGIDWIKFPWMSTVLRVEWA
jgi:hypothetical protein